jgi:hypothetical protein
LTPFVNEHVKEEKIEEKNEEWHEYRNKKGRGKKKDERMVINAEYYCE